MTNGIDFYLANSSKEAAISEKHVKFDEDLHHYLLTREGYPAKRYSLLLNLDQYNDRLFSPNEIRELILICERLLNEYSLKTKKRWETDNFTWRINILAENLKTLCLLALEENKKIFAAGD
ncbi:hypothetical protein [Planococcus soli]|uniref:hypothetical protein n=1 Tax=Planococcus soli TaxID=2666072 RepID=UPI00115F5846|nr:hypothetical protein [Planococcus soli]